MRCSAFGVLACTWLALCGLALLQPSASSTLREGEGAGRTTLDGGVHGEGAVEAWLQVALLAMSPTAVDEQILVADERPLWSTRAIDCCLDWMHRSAALSRAFELKPSPWPRIRRERELGSNFPNLHEQAWVHARPNVSATGVALRGARLSASSSTESFDDLDLQLSFDRPLLVPLAGGGALLLRAAQVPSGRSALELRATWRAWLRAGWASLQPPQAENEFALMVDQQALAGLWLRDEELLRAARAAAPQEPLPELTPTWRRMARRASAIARGEVDGAAPVHPRSWERMLGRRALRLAANDASAQRLAAWLLPAAAQPDFAASLLASDDASNPAFATLVEFARPSVLPAWLRAVPWLWPLLLTAAFVVLVRMVRSPLHGTARPIGVFVVLLLGASTVIDRVAPLPLLRWAVMLSLCLPRWRSMDRTWRTLAAGVLVAELAGLLVPLRLLPNTPVWPNLALLASCGCWVLVRGLVASDGRWIAPGLLTTFTAMVLLLPAASLVPGCAWLAVQLVDWPIVWLLLQLAVLFVFVCLGVRYLDSPPLARRRHVAGGR